MTPCDEIGIPTLKTRSFSWGNCFGPLLERSPQQWGSVLSSPLVSHPQCLQNYAPRWGDLKSCCPRCVGWWWKISRRTTGKNFAPPPKRSGSNSWVITSNLRKGRWGPPDLSFLSRFRAPGEQKWMQGRGRTESQGRWWLDGDGGTQGIGGRRVEQTASSMRSFSKLVGFNGWVSWALWGHCLWDQQGLSPWSHSQELFISWNQRLDCAGQMLSLPFPSPSESAPARALYCLFCPPMALHTPWSEHTSVWPVPELTEDIRPGTIGFWPQDIVVEIPADFLIFLIEG